MTNPRTPEQIQRGNRCLIHVEMVLGMVSGDDVSGAEEYLKSVESTDGGQMRRNVTDLIALRLAILPPELR